MFKTSLSHKLMKLIYKKPDSKLITVPGCVLVFSYMIDFLREILTFHKYFKCSRFLEFHSNKKFVSPHQVMFSKWRESSSVSSPNPSWKRWLKSTMPRFQLLWHLNFKTESINQMLCKISERDRNDNWQLCIPQVQCKIFSCLLVEAGEATSPSRINSHLVLQNE